MLFGQHGAANLALDERKAKTVADLEKILARVAEAPHPGMIDDKITIISHRDDLWVADQQGSDIQLFRVGAYREGDQHFDIVVYRLTIGRMGAFGLHNGDHVDARKQAPTCTTLRPIRFVEVMIPRGLTDEQIEERFGAIADIIAMLESLFPAS